MPVSFSNSSGNAYAPLSYAEEVVQRGGNPPIVSVRRHHPKIWGKVGKSVILVYGGDLVNLSSAKIPKGFPPSCSRLYLSYGSLQTPAAGNNC
ncbi:MAG: hypothetical protein U9R15_16710, partial [Chloroflexota bacterium]|nr:hypothetical protein [Chloroflexota bacterium]